MQLRKPIPWIYGEGGDANHIKVVSHLRDNKTFDEEVREVLLKFTSEREYEELKGKSNIANHLVRRQAQKVTELKRIGFLDEYEHSDMMRQVLDSFNNQGAAERIKSFPFPRQYGLFSTFFVNIFIFLLPFALIKEFGALGKSVSWLMIPFSLRARAFVRNL